ncbi:GNAT family N-acetyltransferase [Actinacidiphila oryziradicis]|uniref:GNAT family N-acetyltransferase n=1 Tax=Actinacidiphila oryziradicis TaxID=2571141 RepID=A0A4V5MZ27_9ACTN|nr:GNAT family N-acetyltransferase [Actinacidiphila oryziradicis]
MFDRSVALGASAGRTLLPALVGGPTRRTDVRARPGDRREWQGEEGRPEGRLRVRMVAEEDLPRLALLDQAIFVGAAYPYFVLRQLFDVHGDRFLVLDHGAGLSGYVLAATVPRGQVSWILGLGVLKQYRGLGHGRVLLAEMLRLLTDDQVGEVRLSVEPHNADAVALYRSLGFTEVGRRDGYFGRGGDRLIMALLLKR